MKGTKKLRQLTAILVMLSIVLQVGVVSSQASAAPVSPSQAYVEKMGKGWNVFNTFDSLRTDDFSLSDETSWGQPRVTQELILAAKAKGFDSIRIPMTAYTRYTLGADGHYVIDSAWLERYKQVVDWAVDAGFYVMINLHHDSWIWLSDWDGNTESEEYKRFVDLWTQLADYFKDQPEKVMFETINEPGFKAAAENMTTQDKLDMINHAAYQVIRNSGGNNATRMIVVPSYYTSADVDKADATYNFIAGLNDPNIIATVHFYTDWVFSANLGRTGFDEPLYGGTETPRSNIDLMFETLNNSFISKGVGVVIGEYGWLSPDDGPAQMQPGEKLKYLEYLNYKASENRVSSMIWPGAFDRTAVPHDWHPLFGGVIKAANKGQRSSYSTGLNEIYVNQPVESDIQIPLTLNGNSFKTIKGVNKKYYSYDKTTATLTLSKEFVNKKFNEGSNGVIADLVLKFSKGADWHQYIIKYSTPEFQTATGTTDGIIIPVDFNSAKVRRAALLDEAGNRIGGTSWFTFMKFGSDFIADYDNGTFSLLKDGLNGVPDGTITLKIEFYDGSIFNYSLQKSGNDVTGLGVVS